MAGLIIRGEEGEDGCGGGATVGELGLLCAHAHQSFKGGGVLSANNQVGISVGVHVLKFSSQVLLFFLPAVAFLP